MWQALLISLLGKVAELGPFPLGAQETWGWSCPRCHRTLRTGSVGLSPLLTLSVIWGWAGGFEVTCSSFSPSGSLPVAHVSLGQAEMPDCW